MASLCNSYSSSSTVVALGQIDAGAPGSGNGGQFITGECLSDADCASGCCGFDSGTCAGPVVAQERDGGCGFGDAEPNDDAAQTLQGGGAAVATSSASVSVTPSASATATATAADEAATDTATDADATEEATATANANKRKMRRGVRNTFA